MPVAMPLAELKVESLTNLHRALTALEISKIKMEQLESIHSIRCHINCLQSLTPSRSFQVHIMLVKQMLQILNETEFSPSPDFIQSVKDVKQCAFESFFEIQLCLERHEDIDSQPIE